MNISEILQSWGMTLPSDFDLYSYFPDEHPENCFLADFFPAAVGSENADKHGQIERQTYLLIYRRMYNVLLKLWALDNLLFDSELLHEKLRSLRFAIKHPKLRARLKHLKPGGISEQKQLDALLESNFKDLIDFTILLEKAKVVILPSFCTFLVYFHDMSRVSELREIFEVEGLHLRKMSDHAWLGEE